MRVHWTYTAIQHLLAIHEHIARDSPLYAQRMVDRLTRRSEQIATFPQSGRIVPEYGAPDIREVIERPYRIIYSRGLNHSPGEEAYLEKRRTAEEGFQRRMVLYFEFDSAEIPEQYRYRLELLGRFIRDGGRRERIRVMGHTCNLGPRGYNRRLSLRRTQRVAYYLRAQFSIEPERVLTTGHGEDHPLLPNENSYARILNRRVEVEISGGSS